MVVPLIVVLSVPPLVWFAHDWTVGNDATRSLFAGSELILGRGLETSDGLPFNGGHGPVFPALIGSLILVFGSDIEALAWALRLLALLNPLLAYLLVKRICSPLAGLIAAALVTLFGDMNLALNIDAVLLMFYLLALLTLLAAIKRGSSSLLASLSGVLLGASILTKESALVSLPLALLAALLLDWELRKALWHYLGVGLVCLLWWIWLWSASGQVYLFDRLPPSLQLPALVAAAALLVVGTLAYATGTAARFLADESRRRWAGWFVALAWTVLLSGLALTTAPALAEASFESLRLYLAELLAPSLVVVPVLILVGGYVLWKALRRDGPWMLLALALVFQIPVCLLVVVEEWAPRQFLVTQTLLFCALAALVVDAGEAALWGRGYSGRIIAALVAIPLGILLLVSSVERVRALLPDNPDVSFERQRVAPQASEMIDWMTENVPEGEHVLVTPAYSLNRYLVFLDAGRHGWTFMRLDQEPCDPEPNVEIRCDLDENAVSRIPPDAVWVQVVDECRAISLSMSNLLEQVRRTGSGYVMISGAYTLPGILKLPPHLQESGAFEVVHSELDHGAASGLNHSLVLLKSTGRTPRAVPTQMTANTELRLRRCEQGKG